MSVRRGRSRPAVQVQAPSFHGLQPGLSLRYSSQAGNGWIGEGWALDGHVGDRAAVGRCTGCRRGMPETITRWTGRTWLPCAGGTARVAASPSCAHQVAGTAGYASQVENYERIAFTPGRFRAGRWTVWRTDGVTVVYQPVTVTGKGVLDWRVSTVRDLSGNTVSYHWTVDGRGRAGTRQHQLRRRRHLFQDGAAVRRRHDGGRRRRPAVCQRPAVGDRRDGREQAGAVVPAQLHRARRQDAGVVPPVGPPVRQRRHQPPTPPRSTTPRRPART